MLQAESVLSESKKVEIECDGGMSVDGNGKIAIFNKNVVLKRGALILKCQKLEVYYTETEGKKSISLLKGYGDVYFNMPDRSVKGNSDTFVYEYQSGKLELKKKGGLTVYTKDGSISSEHVIVNLKTGDAFANKKVVLIFEG